MPNYFTASGRVHRFGAPAPIPAPVRSLRSETAWFTRYRPSLAIRRPSATIRQDRSPSQAPVATPAALPRCHLRRLLPPLTACRLHSAPAPARRTRPLEPKDGGEVSEAAPSLVATLRRRWASDARSRCAARAFAVSKATPRGLPDYSTCAGWQSSARAPPPVRASRYCSLRCAPPCADGAGLRHPPGAADFSVRLGWGPRSAARYTCALVGALISP